MRKRLGVPNNVNLHKRTVSERRKRGQAGNEMIEFALLAALLVPTLLYMFVSGMNLIRLQENTQICRDIGDLYIHGVDFSTFDGQALAQRLSGGLGLQIGSQFAGNNASNASNGGVGYMVLSEVMYVGSGACSALPSGTACTNQNQYVFLQQIAFGNNGITFNGNVVSSALGMTTATMSPSGYVQNYLTDSKAACSKISSLLTTQLSDLQVAYVVETFFSSSNLSFSAVPGGGLYSRIFL
jgi:hypothetical protein